MNKKNKSKNILVFTGGGLAAALNPSLYGVITEARKQGFRVLGGLRGWHWALPQGKIIDISRLNIEPIKNQGGTFLRSSRVNIFNTRGGVASLLKKFKEHKLQAIIAIGGDDTLGTAGKLFEKFNLPIVGVPKTMDNDLFGTYFTPGFPSAAYYLAKLVLAIKKEPAYTLNRVFVIESLGWDAGWATAASCYGGADVILPPEGKYELSAVLKLIKNRYQQNGNYAVVVVCHHVNIKNLAGGIKDKNSDGFGVKRSMYSSLPLQQAVQEKLGLDAKVIMPGNFLESGPPIPLDVKYAIMLGQAAVRKITQSRFGLMASLTRVPGTKKIIVSATPLSAIVKPNGAQKIMDETWFDFKKCTVKPKYLDYMEPILGSVKDFVKNDKPYLDIIDKIKRM